MNASYRLIGQLRIGGFSVQGADPDAPPIDLLTHADPAGAPVFGRPYLILLKLQAGRTQDLADVQRLLAHVPRSERDSMRQLVRRFQPDLVEDYDSLCMLAGLEFGPPPGDVA